MKTKHLYIILALVVAAAVGAVVYYSNKTNSEIANSQSDRGFFSWEHKDSPNLSKEEVMKNENSQAASDSRQLFTLANYKQFNPNGNCDVKFNTDKPNTLVTYTSQAKGLSVSIPYNPNWGTDKLRIDPYEEVTDFNDIYRKNITRLVFGPLSVFEGCGWVRFSAISFIPARSADQAIAQIKKQFTDEYTNPNPTKQTINGLTVIKYEFNGLCDFRQLEVIGKKYNYEVGKICGGEFEELEDIVKTMKLID